RRVKKLEKKKRSRTHKLKRLYKVGLTARVDSSKDKQSLVNDQDDAKIFDVNDLHGEEVFVEKQVVDKEVSAANEVNVASIATTVSAAANITTEEITLAQALMEIKTSKPKAKGIFFTRAKLDEQAGLKLQAEFNEEEQRLAREKTEKKLEANIALIKEWDDIQAKIDVDYQLAQRLQTKEQEELTIKEKDTLFKELLEKQIKHFAAKATEEKRNKSPTQAQQRKIMCTYLKNMEGKKLKDLKNTSFDSIQEMFDRAFNRVNTFVDFRIELVKGSSKRAGEELTQESAKKQKLILIFCEKVEMSRDVLTVGSTMRIPLLYRGEYSQWVERFMNYLEEQTDGEAMINSIKNGDQPLPRVTQVSIAGTTSTEQPPLKDKSEWSAQEKRV
nr:hypothetical protein [Tanacetum cinerariifolium]